MFKEAEAPTSTVRRRIGGSPTDFQITRPFMPQDDVNREGAGSTTEIGGVLFQSATIESSDGLSRLVFSTIINDEIKLATYLNSRYAVARVSENSKQCFIIATKDRVTHDDVSSVVEMIENCGMSLVSEGPQGYFAQDGIVLSLAQGTLTADQLDVARSIRNDKDKNQLMDLFTRIVGWAYYNKASDLDFVVDNFADDSFVAFKISGKYIKPTQYKMPTRTISQMLGTVWQRTKGGADSSFQEVKEQQAALTLHLPSSKMIPGGAHIRLRWQGFPFDKGVVVTMRLQRLGGSAIIQTLEEAGYLPSQIDMLERVIRSRGGLRMMSGEVGSGKSTTIAMLMKRLPNDIKKVSVEDPVEIDVPGTYQKTIARDILASEDDPAFKAAAGSLFRSALDVLYLGEIRDQQTGLVARQVGESGHSVYTTIHARSALGILDRMCSPAIGVPRDVLASPGMMRLMVYQSLLPTTCPYCGLSPEDHAAKHGLQGADLHKHQEYFGRIESLYNLDTSALRLINKDGCDHCRQHDIPDLNGISGRTVVAEMVEPDDQMLEYILAGNSVELHRYWRSLSDMDYTSEDLTGKTAMECAILKASSGQIDPREIETHFTSFQTIELQRRGIRNRKGAAS